LEMEKIVRTNRKRIRQLGTFIDVTNIILGLGIIGLAVTIIITGGSLRILFPIVFIAEALINYLLGIKQIKSNQTGKGVLLIVMGLVMTVVAIIAYLIVK